MDVNVRDVDEIVRFGRSLNSFVSDYLGLLRQVGTASSNDYNTARNSLNRIRSRMESAESNLRSAKGMLEDAIDRANRYPEEDNSDAVAYASSMVEEREAIYQRAKDAFDEAEGIVQRVKQTSDRVFEEVNRSYNQIRENGSDALGAIKHAAQSISRYIKK